MKQRITIAEIIENEWFQKGYRPPTFELEDVSLDDVDAIFDESGVIDLFGVPISVGTIFSCSFWFGYLRNGSSE